MKLVLTIVPCSKGFMVIPTILLERIRKSIELNFRMGFLPIVGDEVFSLTGFVTDSY